MINNYQLSKELGGFIVWQAYDKGYSIPEVLTLSCLNQATYRSLRSGNGGYITSLMRLQTMYDIKSLKDLNEALARYLEFINNTQNNGPKQLHDPTIKRLSKTVKHRNY